MQRNRLDIKDRMPSGMEEYLSQNGWHFNRKLCDWAISLMRIRKRDGDTAIITKSDLEQKLKSSNIEIENCVGYDSLYVYHMAKADFYNSSIMEERNLLQFVKDYIDDIDGYDGKAMTRFYADCIGSGIPIMWEDMI